MILIRAWAHDLHKMYYKRFEPSAAFWVERYNTKRKKVHFPVPPKSPRPWICPVNARTERCLMKAEDWKKSGSASVAGPVPSVEELANHVSLLESIVQNTMSVEDMRADEVLTDLVARGAKMVDDMNRITMNLAREDDITKVRKMKAESKGIWGAEGERNKLRRSERELPFLPLFSWVSLLILSCSWIFVVCGVE